MRILAVTVGLVLLMAAGVMAQALAPFNVARLYVTEAEFTRAVQPYQQAVAANARNATAQYWLGFAYLFAYRQWVAGTAPYASGYLPRAVSALQEAIKLDAAMLPAYIALHDAYHLAREYAKADEVYREMLQKTRPGWIPKVPTW